MNIVVASGDADQLEMLESCAVEIGGQMNPRAPVTVRSVVTADEVRKKINQQTKLLIITSSLAGSREPDQGLRLVEALATQGTAPACIVVGRLELLLSIQAIERCELLVVDKFTDYIERCLLLARRLGVIPPKQTEGSGKPGGNVPPPAGRYINIAPGNLIKRSKFAVLQVDLRSADFGLVHLDIHEDGAVESSEPQMLKLNGSDLADFIQKSKALKTNLAKWQRGSRRRKSSYTQWHVEYRKLGEHVSRMLWGNDSFRDYYHMALGATRAKDGAPNGHIRFRFNLEKAWFDGLWEAISADKEEGHLILENTVTRRFLQPKQFGAFVNQGGQIDTDDGTLNVLVLQSEVPANSTPDGPNDLLWKQYWKSYKGVLPALPHLQQEINELKKLGTLGRTAGNLPNINVTVKVLPETHPRAGEAWSLAEELRTHLEGGLQRYDIVHFAGHALFAEGIGGDERGYLVFSGFPKPRAVPIAQLAPLFKAAQVQLVYLSCCRSSAASAALEFSCNDIPMAIGFHWDLDDSKAPIFAEHFYKELLRNELKVCRAISRARKILFQEHDRGDPIWASPVLIAQPMDWLEVEGVLKLSSRQPVAGRLAG
jgi:CHAT domain